MTFKLFFIPQKTISNLGQQTDFTLIPKKSYNIWGFPTFCKAAKGWILSDCQTSTNCSHTVPQLRASTAPSDEMGSIP
jgi:hypothetical protein